MAPVRDYRGVKLAFLVVAATVASVALLTGCASAVPKPTPPSDDDMQAYNQLMLDKTYENLDLAGVVGKLDTAPAVALDEDGQAVTECMAENGVPQVGMAWSSGQGYEPGGATGSDALTASERVSFYLCVALHPQQGSGRDVLSESERAYLTDYWSRWVMPCLAASGHPVTGFTTEFWGSPYDWVIPTPMDTASGGADPYTRVMERLHQQCGAPYGQIDRLNQPGG